MRLIFLSAGLVSSLLVGCGHNTPVTPEGRLNQSLERRATAETEQELVDALDEAAKESFVLGKTQEARNYATNLLALLPRFANDWNYGNAVQDSNLVLGRIAGQEWRLEDAKRHLLEAGQQSGFATDEGFGPNMSLAQDLLGRGEREAVLEYFQRCRKFWRMDNGRLGNGARKSGPGRRQLSERTWFTEDVCLIIGANETEGLLPGLSLIVCLLESFPAQFGIVGVCGRRSFLVCTGGTGTKCIMTSCRPPRKKRRREYFIDHKRDDVSWFELSWLAQMSRALVSMPVRLSHLSAP